MLAASAASALPRAKTSAKCATVPAPPEAITGIPTASLTAAVSSQSKPARVPSESIEVNRISPAPRCSASRAHSTTRRPIGLAATLHVHLRIAHRVRGFRVAARVDGDDDSLRAETRPMALISVGSARAAELMLTLSAPASNTCSASSRRLECRRRRRTARIVRAPCAARCRAVSAGLRASP